nr:hypothetical protein [Prevotella sp.]
MSAIIYTQQISRQFQLDIDRLGFSKMEILTPDELVERINRE